MKINATFSLLNKKEKISILFVFFLMIINSILEILSIGILIPFISILFEDNNYSLFSNFFFGETLNKFLKTLTIKDTLMLIILVFLSKNLFILFYNFYLGKFAVKTRLRIVKELYDKYLSQNYEFFLSRNSAEIIRNINEAQYFSVVLISFLTLFLEILVLILMVTFLFLINFKITTPVLIALLIVIIILNKTTKKALFKWGEQRQKSQKNINKNIFENFLNIREIKILNKEYFFSEKLINLDKILSSIEFKTDIILQLPRLIIEVTSVIIICLVIYVSFKYFSLQEFLILIALFSASVVRLMPSTTRISAAIQRIRFYQPLINLLTKEFKIKKDSNIFEGKKSIKQFDKLELQNVNFNYKNSKKILSKINLKIKKNTISCIIGGNGSGKTTLVNILSGLLKPKSGKLIINSNYDLQKNRKLNIGYVAQNINLVDDTIKNNIIFGNRSSQINKRNFDWCVRYSGIESFVKKLPSKYNTLVGDRGTKISGGQAQKIGIARALYNNPDILILDEFNSSLDIQSENLIIKNFYQLKKYMTILIISHKKSITKSCDNVFQIKNKILKKIK